MGNKEEQQEAIAFADRRRLRELRALARDRKKLGSRDRLRAAMRVRDLYALALPRTRGGRDAFRDMVLDRIEPQSLRKETFDIAKWKVAKGVTTFEQARARYDGKSEPQIQLATYLAIVAAAAETLKEDVEQAQIEFLKDLQIWGTSEPLNADDAVFDSLELLADDLHRMAAWVTRESGLESAFDQHDRFHFRWEALRERLSSARGNNFNVDSSPVYPVTEIGVNIDEDRPFPSVPLVRVPLGFLDTHVQIEMGEGAKAMHPGSDRVPGQFLSLGARLIQYREVRLALAPTGRRNYGAALMSRGWVGLRLEGDDTVRQVFGTLHWSDRLAYEQEVHHEGGWRRVRFEGLPEDLSHVAAHVGTDYDWEYDPVERPGALSFLGADYVSYMRVTPDQLFHWLVDNRSMEGEGPQSPLDFMRVEGFGVDSIDHRRRRPEFPDDDALPFVGFVLEPLGSSVPLDCPMFSLARVVEEALKTGIIENALLAKARAVVNQTQAAVEEMQPGRAEALSAIRRRWDK